MFYPMDALPHDHLMVQYVIAPDRQGSLSDMQYLFLQDIAKLIQFCVKHNIKLTGGELHRTYDTQLKHFKAGRSQTMNSDHLIRLAIDFNFFFDGVLSYDSDKIRIVGEYWKELRKGNYWGGDWKSINDAGHFGTK